MKLILKTFGLFLILYGCSTNKKTINPVTENFNKNNTMNQESRIIRGGISGQTISLPDVNSSSTTSVDPSHFVKNGLPVPGFNLNNSKGFKDVLSFNRKFGLLIPATNTSMEHELWSIIMNNQENGNLDGVGLHTTNIQIPKVTIQSESDLEIFKNGFINSLNQAVDEALLAKPQYLIMGMSLEHILYGIDKIKTLMNSLDSSLSWATWHEAADAALKKYKAKRIGIISPFNRKGNENAQKMFEDMGYEVVMSFGFGCTDLVDIAHIPDSAKEDVILNYLAIPENRLDAIVQLGTNMSMIQVSEKLEPKVGIPILGINAVTFWYALRENGFSKPLIKSGRLLREF